MMWKIQGSLCSPTVLRLQHIKVPYSKVRVGVKVKRLVDPLVRINRSLTVLASAELLKVHLKFQRYHCYCDKSFNFFPPVFHWPEGHLWRIGFDVACDVRGFHLGHTVNFDTLRFTHRRNCKVINTSWSLYFIPFCIFLCWEMGYQTKVCIVLSFRKLFNFQ